MASHPAGPPSARRGPARTGPGRACRWLWPVLGPGVWPGAADIGQTPCWHSRLPSWALPGSAWATRWLSLMH